MKSKICGISDIKTLKYLTNHLTPPEFIGFIVNYPKSKRYVTNEKLKKLMLINKKKSSYVAVLINPNKKILEEIKNLPFDFYQLYDCSPKKTFLIKNKYKKKIISAFTIQNFNDIRKYQMYNDVADIFLFDGKGYEKSISFDHTIIENIKFNKEIMIAGNIQINDDLENYRKITDIIDISGSLETLGKKDKKKINFFLENINKIKNEN